VEVEGLVDCLPLHRLLLPRLAAVLMNLWPDPERVMRKNIQQSSIAPERQEIQTRDREAERERERHRERERESAT
jgi:hypothetical protein